MFRPCPQCGDFYVREKGVCPRCWEGEQIEASLKRQDAFFREHQDEPNHFTHADADDLAADSYRERREERQQREADRADFARHE